MKTLKTLSVLLLILTFASCGQPKPDQQDGDIRADSDQPVFYLSELPQLAPFEIPPEITSRYSEEAFVDKLVPADDYGKLYPYEGKRIVSEGMFWESSLYGLVDAKGRIVVDPVYESAYYLDPGSEYLYLVNPVEMGDEPAEDSIGEELSSRGIVIANSHGGWVTDGLLGNWANYSEERIIVSGGAAIDGEFRQNFKVYDLSGNLVFEGDGYFNGFSEGLGAVTVYERELGGGQSERSWMQYIDRNGNVVIPGPFYEAGAFNGGEALVAVGEEWETARYGVINTKGEFKEPPTMSWNDQKDYYSQGEYRCVYRDKGLQGINDSDGNVVLPAEYDWIAIDQESSMAIAGCYEDSCYYVVSLPSGEKEIIDGNVTGAYFSGGGWRTVEYAIAEDGKKVMALTKGDKERKFDYSEYSWLQCNFIKGSVFALSYWNWAEEDSPLRNSSRTDIFDADTGKTTKSFPRLTFSHVAHGGLCVMQRQGSNQLLVFNEDFEPFFPDGAFEPGGLTRFSHLAGDVYQVRTAFSSGLIRENGEWLIRVNMSSID
ncbi:MAG: WG repeat-containing protein [Clostridiales bacterium]|nr:WG repeat-containing protein [Clostridiales bacterium]